MTSNQTGQSQGQNTGQTSYLARPRTSGMLSRGQNNGNQDQTNANNNNYQYGTTANPINPNTSNNLTRDQPFNRVNLVNQNKSSNQVTQQSHGGLHIVGMSGQNQNTFQQNNGSQFGQKGSQGNRNKNIQNDDGGQKSQVFYHLNNNFMITNGQNQQNPQNIHSGVGGVVNGQKTAYGYVGGINGQGLNSMISHSNFNGTVINSFNNLNNKNRNLSSKSTTGNNTLINSQNKMIQKGLSAGYGQVLLETNPSNSNDKRVLSANRANSINNQNSAQQNQNAPGIQQQQANSNSSSNHGANHQAQQFSMQQRRRQQQNVVNNKIINNNNNNNYQGSHQTVTNYTNNGTLLNRTQVTNGVLINQNNSQILMHQSAQSQSSVNFAQIGANSSSVTQQKSNQYQGTQKLGAIKSINTNIISSQNFHRISSTGVGQSIAASGENKNNTGENSTDEGFMRGARIAEKIQEYINPQANNNQQQINGVNNQANPNANLIKSYVVAANKAKQIRQQKGNNFKVINGKVQVENISNQQWIINNQGAQNQNQGQGNINRAIRTSHGTNSMRSRGQKGSQAEITQQNENSKNAQISGMIEGNNSIGGIAKTENITTDQSQVNNQDILGGVFRGRASSSYGSLQSRQNNVAQQNTGQLNSNISKQNQINTNIQMKLNKSGISATSGILNYSNYNSNGTMISSIPPNLKINENQIQSSGKQYQDQQQQNENQGLLKNSTHTNTITSNYEKFQRVDTEDAAINSGQKVQNVNQITNNNRPQTRDIKLRSQAYKNNFLGTGGINSNNMQSISQTSQNQTIAKQKSGQSLSQNIQNTFQSSQNKQKTQSQNLQGNKLKIGQINSQGLAGTPENFDGRQSLNGNLQLINNETRTFQNTINIGSFINEINNQNSNNSNNIKIAGSLFNNNQNYYNNNGLMNLQSESLQNLNFGANNSNIINNKEGKALAGGNITTFSNTIENTDQSIEGQNKSNGDAGINLTNESRANDKELPERISQNIINEIKEQNNSADINKDKLGKQLQSADVKKIKNNDMFIQDPSQDNNSANQKNKNTFSNQRVSQKHHNEEPLIKIQNQQSDSKLNTVDEENQTPNNVAQSPGVQENNVGIIPSSDIRQIKLNYIQLNKRATTASNNQQVLDRKIPQKQNTVGEKQLVDQKIGIINGNQSGSIVVGKILPQSQQQQQQVNAVAQWQANQQFQVFDKQGQLFQQNQPAGLNAKKTQFGAQNVYTDQNQMKIGNLTMNNWTSGTQNLNGTLQMSNQQQIKGASGLNAVNSNTNLQSQFRQLQTRQTRRIINANVNFGEQQIQNQNGQRNQSLRQDQILVYQQQNNERAASNGQQLSSNDLGRGLEYVHQHILQQQQNQNQAIHLAQTHALAYHVDKYQDGTDQAEGSQQEAQNQFCTEGSNIENIDNYIIGKRIGQGAYAVVRVGLHKILNQKIAVKIYEKFKLLEPNRRKSVKREIKIMEKIDHECLAKLFEAFESHKQVFLIMEYVNGGSLHGYLKGKPNRQMAEIEAKYVWQQVVFAIHYLHQRNVTHRDIKLENILLDETRTRVKLIDFGFSTCIPHEKKVKIFCGTPSYMAPEIVSKIEYSGPPADIWALGVLLYALLCGRFPFKGQNDKELYTNICQQDLPLPDHISKQGRQLLVRIFHKNPDKRPSAKDILRDPWLQFSLRDQEMMSPKSLAFISYLKKMSQINFGGNNQGAKLNLNNTTTAGFSRSSNAQNKGDSQMPMELSYTSFHIQSKDKRHQLHASDVKQFILDDNQRKAYVITQKKQNQSITSELGSVNTYNQLNIQSQQQITAAFQSNNFQIGQSNQGTRIQGKDANNNLIGIRYNLNNTMPVGGIVTESLNMTQEKQFLQINQVEIQQKNSDVQGPNLTGGNESLKKPNSKINMDAYNAYYNTNDISGVAHNQNNNFQNQNGATNPTKAS